MRRSIDVVGAFFGLTLLSPVLIAILFLVWMQDKHSPFYVAQRAGKNGVPFRMVKIRSMIQGADKTGVESTGLADWRITKLGHFIRRTKIDEILQLWNVLKGDMSLVGPRPNTLKETASYDAEQIHLLDVKPGITDFSSIVFSDEGDIIKDSLDPDAAYFQLIWPWKSKLGLLYARHASAGLDLRLIWITLVAIRDRAAALRQLQPVLACYTQDAKLLEVSRRQGSLSQFL